MRQIADLSNPTVPQRPQPGLPPMAADRCLKRKRRRDRQMGCIVRCPHMNARHYVGACGVFGGIGIDRADPLAADINRAAAKRRSDPLVQVDTDEIGFEVREMKVELPDAVSGVHDRVDAALASDCDDVGDRQD